MTIQIKIALLFTLVCTLIIIGLSFAVFYFANANAFQDFYTRLELRAVIAAKAVLDLDHSNKRAYEQIRNEHLHRLPLEEEHIIPIDSLPAFAKTKQGKLIPPQFLNSIITVGNANYRRDYRFYRGLRYNSHRGGYAIILSAVHRDARIFLTNLKAILITANFISTMVFFSAGIIFSRRILAPLRRITREVKNINATSLHQRLTVSNGEDEIAELEGTFNDMVSRLETSFETQNNFVSNASHELNTPLTAIIGEAEFGLAKTRNTEEYRKGLQVILNQADKLRNITRALLELAQTGFTENLSYEVVNISELMRSVIQVASNIYPGCTIVRDRSLESEDSRNVLAKGNFHLLELCISNVLLNACKYANQQKVTIALATSDSHIIFIIKDKGIGIPDHDMPHIFDPFFRASNAAASKGYGIGLPLAQNIIKLHKGTINITSKLGEGTEVVIKIPKYGFGA